MKNYTTAIIFSCVLSHRSFTMSKMSIVPFSSVVDFSSVLTIGALSKGAVGTLYVDALDGHSNLFSGPTQARQSYPIKPQGLNSTVKPTDKFEINLQVSAADCAAFVDAAARFDQFVLKSVFGRKTEVLPKKADVISSVDALNVLYHNGRLIKAGTEDKNGGRYPDHLRLKIVGDWATFVRSVNTKTIKVNGSDKTVIDSVEWKPRYTPVTPNETRFYLFVRTNEEGKPVYTDKVASADGARLVGPQDCRPGDDITPLFSISHVYVSEGIGCVATARALYIHPFKPSAGDDVAFAVSSSAIPLLDGAVLETDAAADRPVKKARTE